MSLAEKQFNGISIANHLFEELSESSDPTHPDQIVYSEDELQIAVMELRSLVQRHSFLKKELVSKSISSTDEGSDSQIVLPPVDGGFDLNSLLDADLIEETAFDSNPDLEVLLEIEKVEERIVDLMHQDSIREEYAKLFNIFLEDFKSVRKLLRAFKRGYFIRRVKHEIEDDTEEKTGATTKKEKYILKSHERVLVARQILRILTSFRAQCKEEIQNVHNQVKRNGRDYQDSDLETLNKLQSHIANCDREMNMVLQSPEVAVQKRMDQIARDRRILQKSKDATRQVRDDLVRSSVRTDIIETKSRKELIYGNGGAERSILGALRGGQPVCLFGPTGTGKTKVGEAAATIYSGKPPQIVPGGPGVYRDSFYGYQTDLGKREQGALIRCMKEGKVLLIDEDNLIANEVMSELKSIFNLKAGMIFYHPDTGEKIKIQPGFGIMTTRNEKGKKHANRQKDAVELKRVFSHGRFQVGYYTPEEMYYRFFLPKLSQKDGSIQLSEEEIGGDMNDPNNRSPLLSLVNAAKEIQEEYMADHIKEVVFESGYLIDLFNEWPEMRLLKKSDGNQITFLEFLETKLQEFVRDNARGNDRRKILEILIRQGFFKGFTADQFSSVDEGAPIPEDELRRLIRGPKVFKTPSQKKLSAQEVARLDPFDVLQIPEIEPHPLEAEIVSFRDQYSKMCDTLDVMPELFEPFTIEEQLPDIAETIHEMIDIAAPKGKSQVMKKLLDKKLKAGLESFLEKVPVHIFRFLSPPEVEEDEDSSEILELEKGKEFISIYHNLCEQSQIDPIQFSPKTYSGKRRDIKKSIVKIAHSIGLKFDVQELYDQLPQRSADVNRFLELSLPILKGLYIYSFIVKCNDLFHDIEKPELQLDDDWDLSKLAMADTILIRLREKIFMNLEKIWKTLPTIPDRELSQAYREYNKSMNGRDPMLTIKSLEKYLALIDEHYT